MCLPGTVEKVREQTRSEDGPRLDRRAVLLGGVGAAVAATFPARATAGRSHRREKKKHLEDLTHVFTDGFPVFTFDPPASEVLITIPTGGFYAQKWTFGEHSGTHMDAPGHFVEGGRLSPDITLEELIVPIVVIDISSRAARDPDTAVTVDDLRRFERRRGRIPDGALVCMDSGWAAKVDDPLEFKGGDAFPNYHFPGFSLEAAMWLAERRDVTGIGVDTISLDPGNSQTFPVHVNFLATDRYGLEGLNNLDQIPPEGAVAYVGLIPWEKGSGGPCRVIASW
ncbi:MAG TPA: cyclase family protein [Gaiellaceae bacterium]|nr:cyclase family protein [Gaiellaceae bacterium]